MKLIDAEHLKRWLTTRWLESDPTSDKPIKMADILNQIDYGEFSIDLVRCGECVYEHSCGHQINRHGLTLKLTCCEYGERRE